jgi:hypothetical protein
MQKLAVFMVGGLFTAPDNHDAQIALAKDGPLRKSSEVRQVGSHGKPGHTHCVRDHGV